MKRIHIRTHRFSQNGHFGELFWLVSLIALNDFLNGFRAFRWLKPLFNIGLTRSIKEDDIYAVTNSLRSDRNTEEFAKLWQLEMTKKNPSVLRVIWKIHGLLVFGVGFLFALGETLA